jgi:hypothetical protein
MNALLSTAYWPNLHYFYYVLRSETILIENHENYEKQSYRNRCRILSANGPLDLFIPVKNRAQKQKISEIEISYGERWQAVHWGAITSAYRNSPYFEFFEDAISPFYKQRTSLLMEYNSAQLKVFLKIIKENLQINYTSSFDEKTGEKDLRKIIHPKLTFETDVEASLVLNRPYYQTFGNKFPFIPNLSILDLLFNKGIDLKKYF